MKQKFIEWFTKNNNGCSPAMEDDRSFVREKTQHMFEAYQAGVAEGEARFSALAAENGQMLRLLTDISENHDEYVNQDEYLYAGVPMDYVSEINAYVSRDVEAENPFKATDSFLAEVRAQGVEMFGQWLRDSADIFDKNSRHDWADQNRVSADKAGEFSAQLRKGVQS